MTDKEKKFKSKAPFETYDQGGQFDPIKVPDLKPYLDANRAVEQKDMQIAMNLGLADLKLEQDRTKGVEAYNAVVQDYIARSNVSMVANLSESITSFLGNAVKLKDKIDQRNAMQHYMTALENGDLPTLTDIWDWNNSRNKAKAVDDGVQTIAGDLYRSGGDIDNVNQVRDLSGWEGPYRMELLLKHHSDSVPAWFNNNKHITIDGQELLDSGAYGIPGKKYSIAEGNYDDGHSAAQRAFLEKTLEKELYGMFAEAGFPPAAVATYIQPAVAKYQKEGAIDWSDKTTTRFEAARMADFRADVEAAFSDKSSKTATVEGITAAIDKHTKFSGNPSLSTQHAFSLLEKMAKEGLISEHQLNALYEQEFIPRGQKKPVKFSKVFNNQLTVNDPIDAAQDFANDKRLQSEKNTKTLIYNTVEEARAAAAKYQEDNGAPPPPSFLTPYINKLNDLTETDTYNEFADIITTHNRNAEKDYADLEVEFRRNGGYLTPNDLKGKSPEAVFKAYKAGMVSEPESTPDSSLVKSAKGDINILVSDKLKTQGDYDRDGVWVDTKNNAHRDYQAIYRAQLLGGSSQQAAHDEAFKQVKANIAAGQYQHPPKTDFSSKEIFVNAAKELSTNKGNVRIPIKALKPSIEKAIKFYKDNGYWQYPEEVKSLAAQSGYSSNYIMKNQVEALGEKFDEPRQEQELNKLSNRRLLQYCPTKGRCFRASVDGDLSKALVNDFVAEGFNGVAKQNGDIVHFKWEEQFGTPIENQTIGEVLDILESGKALQAGNYQFTKENLPELLEKAGLTTEDVMSEENQQVLFNASLVGHNNQSRNRNIPRYEEAVAFSPWNNPQIIYGGVYS